MPSSTVPERLSSASCPLRLGVRVRVCVGVLVLRVLVCACAFVSFFFSLVVFRVSSAVVVGSLSSWFRPLWSLSRRLPGFLCLAVWLSSLCLVRPLVDQLGQA